MLQLESDGSKVIFDARERKDLDVAFHRETTFEYLDRSARPEMAVVRSQWNDWFGRYPDQPSPSSAVGKRLREALRSRLTARRERNQTEAFWELYLHESFLRAGARVLVREDTPDFEVAFGMGTLSVEATVRGLSAADEAHENRIKALRDGLNRTQADSWLLDVGANSTTEDDAPVAALRRDIEKWIKTFDVDVVRDQCERMGPKAYGELPKRTFERAGWTIHVRLIPKREGVRREGRQPAIGVWSGPGVFEVHNAECLGDSLRAKARRLRCLAKPVVLAVLLDRPFGDDDDVLDALFGREIVRISIDPNMEGNGISGVETSRRDDGLWSVDDGPGQQLDAVLLGIGLNPFLIGRASPVLWSNPRRHSGPFTVPPALPWTKRWLDEEGNVVSSQGPDPAAFFRALL